jgi:hypothetical protein
MIIISIITILIYLVIGFGLYTILSLTGDWDKHIKHNKGADITVLILCLLFPFLILLVAGLYNLYIKIMTRSII